MYTEEDHIRMLNTAENDALVKLYNSTNGSEWKLSKNWLNSTSPCEVGKIWYGISCLHTDVIGINLENNNLNGILPSQIGTLTVLTHFSLFSNSIIGRLPSEIGQFTKIQTLPLSNNQFSGSLPSQIGRLTLIGHNVSLHNNLFTGSVPSEIGLLDRLSVGFSLKSNRFNNSLPSQIGKLLRIDSDFDISENGFSLHVPSELGSKHPSPLLSLVVPRLHTSLSVIYIYYVSLGSMHIYNNFYLSYNSFCGSIPDEVSNLKTQVAGFDILTGNDGLNVSCCIYQGAYCTPSPTTSPPTLLPSTLLPSPNPTKRPTHFPSSAPSMPTKVPSVSPTHQPSSAPSHPPSTLPTVLPSSIHPTQVPSLYPSLAPTPLPTTPEPTSQPTAWMDRTQNSVGVSIGCAGVFILLLFFMRKKWVQRKREEYMEQVLLSSLPHIHSYHIS